jgi:3-hydroxyisobutyrate dehydrogenase/2-hydroxy-3-oxopropionate reductase
MANQIIIAGTISGVCEALIYAKEKGLDLQVLFDSVSTGAAGGSQLTNQGAKIIKGNYDPGFFIKHFIKDMKLAKDEAESAGLSLEVLNQALTNYQELEDAGFGELGTQALIKHYEKN